MKDFMFKAFTRIIFGVNASLELKELLESMKFNKLFIVTDHVLEKTPPFIAMCNKLKEQNFELTIFSETEPDPSIEVVDAAADILRNSQAEAVIAVGGGSSIDTAKAMCMLVTNDGSVKEYLFGGSKTVKNKALPLIAIPTTAGSGSEVTAASVITDQQRDIKLSVTHEYLMPLVAIIDPVMHCGMPPLLTASTGMDALTHAIEAYVSLNAETFSDAYAEKAIKLIGENIRTATFNPTSIEARSNMAMASVMAAISFMNGGLGAVHGIAQAMGGIAHTPHGIANSLLLPYVMEINVMGNLEKFSNIAELLGENTEGMSKRKAADLSIIAVRRLVEDLRIPMKLVDLEKPVTKEMFPTIVEGTMAYRLLSVNPVKIREQDVYKILEKAYE